MINAEKFSTELEKLINNKAKIAIVRGVPCNCNDIIINCFSSTLNFSALVI